MNLLSPCNGVKEHCGCQTVSHLLEKVYGCFMARIRMRCDTTVSALPRSKKAYWDMDELGLALQTMRTARSGPINGARHGQKNWPPVAIRWPERS